MRILPSRRQSQLGAQHMQRPEHGIDGPLEQPQRKTSRSRTDNGAEFPQCPAQPLKARHHRRIVGREKHHGLQHHRDPRNTALFGGEPGAEAQAARQQQIGVRDRRHHVLVSRSEVGQHRLSKQEIAAPHDPAHELGAAHAEVMLQFREAGPEWVEPKAGRLHLASVLGSAGDQHVHAADIQGLP